MSRHFKVFCGRIVIWMLTMGDDIEVDTRSWSEDETSMLPTTAAAASKSKFSRVKCFDIHLTDMQ